MLVSHIISHKYISFAFPYLRKFDLQYWTQEQLNSILLLKYLSFIMTCKHYFYLFTYLLTPWSRVLFKKLTSSQLVKKFTAFYGARRFITTFTSARQLSLS